MRAKVKRDAKPGSKYQRREYQEWEFVLVLDGADSYLLLTSYRIGTRKPKRVNPIWEAAYGNGSPARIPSKLRDARRLSLAEVPLPEDVQNEAREDLIRQIKQVQVIT